MPQGSIIGANKIQPRICHFCRADQKGVFLGAHKDQRLERVANTIIFFTAINNYYSNTDWYIIIYIQ